MRDRIRLGHVAGIRVGLDISALASVAILLFGLVTGRFPAVFPGRPLAEYIAAAVAVSALFLVSLLVRELGRAVAARRAGIGVSGITLWLLGGVSWLRGEPRDPATALRIAAAGPLASVAAAAVFATFAVEISVFTGRGLATAVFAYLAGFNLLLAVFHLLPAPPLDGAAALQAILWRRGGDRARAAVLTGKVGRGAGYALIAAGLLQAVSGRGWLGLWPAAIGLFLVHAATTRWQVLRAGAERTGANGTGAAAEEQRYAA
jgi:Zn-dependent protease